MGLRSRMLAGFASQLGLPTGLRGRAVGAMLNRSNRGTIAIAIRELEIPSGAVAADLGFGGGVGLEMLLERVGHQGQVHGVDLSPTMVSRASRRFGRDVASSRLHLHTGSITQLPLDDASIQAAITINTIYFIADLNRAFSELARILTPSGRVVVGIGDPEAMARMPTTPYGFKLRPVAEITAAAESAGLALRDDKRSGQGDAAAHLLVFEHAS
ncbi:MAG: class I SAM-dependent methyltransferase [Chloroflexi bacterium]|nr:MAG: class I SAM-dependent methyltransferase [Chloroflexota bacterium]